VGWLIIACMLGVLVFRWQRGSAHPLRIMLLAAGIFVTGLVVWAVYVEYAWSVTQFFAVVGDGTVARFLLGLGFGFGAAYVVVEFLPKEHSGGGHKAPITLLGTAFGIVLLLALAAPHLDNWLRRAASIKSAFVELQLTSATTHTVAVAESGEAQSVAFSLDALTNMASKIRQDIEYMEVFETFELTAQLAEEMHGGAPIQAQLSNSKVKIDAAKSLVRVFEGLISPVAKCVQIALKNRLSVESLRQAVRPIADNLHEIIFNIDNQGFARVANEKHKQFWLGVVTLLKKDTVVYFLRDNASECLDRIDAYVKNENWYPKISDFTDSPYLYAAAAHLLNFLGDNEAAVGLLTNAKPKFKDYGFLTVEAWLRYFQGAPPEYFVRPLEEIRSTARIHQAVIEGVKNRCAIGPCDSKRRIARLAKKLTKRERGAELYAVNEIVYDLSEDLARGTQGAVSYQALAETLAGELLAAASDKDNAPYRDNFLDTYAYVSIVLEARKPDPDVNTFRKMARILENVVENQSRVLADQTSSGAVVSRADLSGLRISRTHLAAARQLAGD
jgi:hypothetical protein